MSDNENTGSEGSDNEQDQIYDIQSGLDEIGKYNMLNSDSKEKILADQIWTTMTMQYEEKTKIESEYIRLDVILYMSRKFYNLDKPIFSIEWILENLDKSVLSRDIKNILKKQLKKDRPLLSQFIKRDLNTLQNLLDNVVRYSSDFRDYKKYYLSKVRSETDRVFSSGNPDYREEGLEELVGSFLFNGRKNKVRSRRKKSLKLKSIRKKSR